MKKSILLAVAAIMATINVCGQDAYADMKHEVAVSSGGGSTSNVIDAFRLMSDVSDMGIQGDMMFDTHRLHGPYSIEYFYRPRPWLGVGGMFIYGTGNMRVYSYHMDGKRIVEEATHESIKGSYLSVMPAVKLDWIRRQYFGMYSKVALGLTSRHVYVDYVNTTRGDEELRAMHLNGQLTLVGMDFGSPHFRGFFDLGFGEQGLLLLGLRYKF